MGRPRRRTIKGVQLLPGGLLPGESRVSDWPGGELRVVYRQPKIPDSSPLTELVDLPIEEIAPPFRQEYVPFGDGFALPTPLIAFDGDTPGLGFDIGIRDGRPVCTAIHSDEGGPPITTTLLRSRRLPPIGRLVTRAVARAAVRVVRTVDGEVIGIASRSTGDPEASWEATVADVAKAVDDLHNAERRWRMTADHLREVAAVYREAYDKRLPTGREIARRWATSEQNARRWVARARKEGYLPPTEERRARR